MDASTGRIEPLPYLIGQGYLEHTDPAVVWRLGHGISVTLVTEGARGPGEPTGAGVVRSCNSAEIAAANLSVNQARDQALERLGNLIRSQQIGLQAFPQGPGGRPFALFGGHFAASSCILLPALIDNLAPYLGPDLVASVPHRGAMPVFPFGDAAQLEEARAFVHAHEGMAPNQLTLGFFRLTPGGPTPLG